MWPAAWSSSRSRSVPSDKTWRASLGPKPPLLESDVLAVNRKSPNVVVQEREQVVEDVGLGAGQSRSAELPGIDDGGDVQRLRCGHPATIPSDGRPYRVPLF